MLLHGAVHYNNDQRLIKWCCNYNYSKSAYVQQIIIKIPYNKSYFNALMHYLNLTCNDIKSLSTCNFFSETRFLTSLCPFYTVHIVCSDKPELPICSQLPTYGNFCTEYFNWSVKHCPKSCGFCGGTVVETFSFLVYLFIFYYFLIYSLFAPMDKCHHTTFKKKNQIR